MATATDSRIGKRVELHPATDRWMMGDCYGEIVGIGKHARSFIDPQDSRNGVVFRVKMDKSGKVLRVSEANIGRIFS